MIAFDNDVRYALRTAIDQARRLRVVRELEQEGIRVCRFCNEVEFEIPPAFPGKIYCSKRCGTLAHGRMRRAAEKREREKVSRRAKGSSKK